MASEVVNKSVDGDKVTLTFRLETEEVCRSYPIRCDFGNGHELITHSLC